MNTETPVLEVESLRVAYSCPAETLFGRRRQLRAVDDVSFQLHRGEALGLVGETGCGKSSLGRALYGLVEPASGSVKFSGRERAALGRAERKALQRQVQMIFQDPGGSLDPRMKVAAIVAEPLEIHGEGDRTSRRRRVEAALEEVGLDRGAADRFPHEFSGGQRQRIAIARAIILTPELVIADEPVSALDVSLQAQILNLIASLRRELGLALLFVSHDLGVVGYLCDRVAVMYLGRIVEIGSVDGVLGKPGHPYTRELRASSPVPDPSHRIESLAVEADPPDPAAPPSGCRYHPRCPMATVVCREKEPHLRNLEDGRQVACHHVSGMLPDLKVVS